MAPNRLLAADLVVWFQLLCLTGPLALARPKRLRWDLWHAPARIISTARRDIVRILDGWPTADVIVAAYQNIAALNTVNVDAVSIAPTAANQTRLTSEKTAPTRRPDPAPRYTTPSIVPPPHNHQPRHPNPPPVNDRG